MGRTSRLLLVVLLALASTALCAAPASAASPIFTITPNPATGGDTVTFRGTGCLPTSSDPADQGPAVYLSAEGQDGSSDAITPEPDGSWAYTIALPQGIAIQTVTFDAVCDGYTSSFGYAPVTLRIQGRYDGAFLFLPAFVDVWNQVPQLEVRTPYEFDAYGFIAGEQVTLALHSDPVELGTFQVDDRGEVIGTFSLPADTVGGPHELRLTGSASQATASLAVTVVPLVLTTSTPVSAPSSVPAPGTTAGSATDTSPTSATTVTPSVTTSTPTPGPVLAATGSKVSGLLGIGMGLAMLGTALLLFAGRPARWRHSH